MNEHEKKRVIDRYTDRLKQFGYSPETLGWTKKRHYLRYHILLSQWSFNGERLLDFGCGFGDMGVFIKEKALQIDYHGVDINEELIKEGIKCSPDIDLRAIDILSEHYEESFDYVVSSGVHNLKLEDNWSFIEATFEKFNNIATKGFALNFISNNVDRKDDHIYYCDPAKVLRLAYKYSNRVILRNDYMPFEFTIFIFKDREFSPENAVYRSYQPLLFKK